MQPGDCDDRVGKENLRCRVGRERRLNRDAPAGHLTVPALMSQIGALHFSI
jgi:hypothetical protein